MMQQNENAETKRKRLSTRNLMLIVAVLAVLVIAMIYSIYPPTTPSSSTDEQTTIAFDFDTSSPFLIEGQNTPLSQTSNGLTASFSSPSDSATPAFSIQSYDTTFFELPQFSGRWLYDNKPSRDLLDIEFSQLLASINFTFATLEYHGGPSAEPSNITLVAFVNSTDTIPVESTVVHGTFISASYPQGTLSFNSRGRPFNLVRIEIPYVPQGATDFFLDNIIVTTMQQE